MPRLLPKSRRMLRLLRKKKPTRGSLVMGRRRKIDFSSFRNFSGLCNFYARRIRASAAVKKSPNASAAAKKGPHVGHSSWAAAGKLTFHYFVTFPDFANFTYVEFDASAAAQKSPNASAAAKKGPHVGHSSWAEAAKINIFRK